MFYLQQDNAPAYKAASTMDWFAAHGVNLLQWPALSPDLNPIENLWGFIARRVYQGGKQYADVCSLIGALEEAWNAISFNHTSSLVNSMNDRLFNVIYNHGRHSGY